jgi:hypothetical protein
VWGLLPLAEEALREGWNHWNEPEIHPASQLTSINTDHHAQHCLVLRYLREAILCANTTLEPGNFTPSNFTEKRAHICGVEIGLRSITKWNACKLRNNGMHTSKTVHRNLRNLIDFDSASPSTQGGGKRKRSLILRPIMHPDYVN